MDPKKKYDAGAEAQKRLTSMATGKQQSAAPFKPSASQTKGSNNPESGRFKTAVKNFLNPSVNIKGHNKAQMKAVKKDIKSGTYAENAAVKAGMNLDLSKNGSAYNSVLSSRAYKKNEADQRGISVGKMKSGYKHKDAALDAGNSGKVSRSDENRLTYKQTAKAAEMVDKGKDKKAKKYISRKKSKNERKLIRKTGNDMSTVSTMDHQRVLNKL
jgi:hypothetical protein